MKVRLMFEDREFQSDLPLPPQAEALCKDLELEGIISAMAEQDSVIESSVRQALLQPLTDGDEILRRQAILQDLLEQPNVLEEIYHLVSETLEKRKEERWWFCSDSASNRFYGSVQLLKNCHNCLIRLRKIADREISFVHSEGLQRLLGELCTELDDEFLKESGDLLEELEFKDGTMMEVYLDRNQRAAGYRLVRKNHHQFRLRWGMAPSFTLAPRDTAGAQDLAERCDMAFWGSGKVLSETADHIEQYLVSLRQELAFFMGAANLYRTMGKKQISCCFPSIAGQGSERTFVNLKELSLALRVEKCVGNDLQAKGQLLYIVTGANQGGKTTFLRSLGQAQLLFQCGLFVPAEYFCSHICQGIFTHFGREEDRSLHSGRLDEELQRLDSIIPLLKQGSLLLFNESFASTNEREGSEICRQISAALLEHGIEQVHVTHLFTFANKVYLQNRSDVTCLRAERLPNGTRSFKICPGEPLQTAYGKDLYRKIWNDKIE